MVLTMEILISFCPNFSNRENLGDDPGYILGGKSHHSLMPGWEVGISHVPFPPLGWWGKGSSPKSPTDPLKLSPHSPLIPPQPR